MFLRIICLLEGNSKGQTKLRFLMMLSETIAGLDEVAEGLVDVIRLDGEGDDIHGEADRKEGERRGTFTISELARAT